MITSSVVEVSFEKWLQNYDYNLFHEVNVDLAMADILEDEKTHESVGVPTTRSSKDDRPTNNCGTLCRLIDLRTIFFEFDANHGLVGSVYHAYIPEP